MMAEQESILIVDDEASIRKLLHHKLSSEGYQCQQAGNAEQALDKLKNNLISLVVLDINVPGESGIELLPEIKAVYPDTAVVMATAASDIDVAIQCMRQDAYDYITKPFNLDDVVLSLGRALEKRRLELENREYQQHLEDKIAEQTGRIRASFLNAIRALAYALEAKDKYTSGHSQRVADISTAIAKEVGLSGESVDRIVLVGLVHDIGKIGVTESVLNKSELLTNDEFQHVKKHPGIGERILAPVADDEDILKLVRNHHERYDGSGYPDGLKSGQIPLGARILAIANAYEAMTSERPYRKAMNDKAASAEIERGNGTQFDPGIADAFLRNKDGS